MDKETAIKLSKKFVSKVKDSRYALVGAFMFGSYAKGTQHSDSDIDIAVVLNTNKNRVLLQTELMKLRRDICTEIEPHPIAIEDWENNDFFSQEIKKTGIKL